MTLAQAAIRLTRSLYRLQPSQGRVARRNARQKVLYAVRVLVKTMEELYPNIPGVRKPRRKRSNRFDDFVPVKSIYRVAMLAEAKVTTYEHGKEIYAPGWACDLMARGRCTADHLRRAKTLPGRVKVQAELTIREHTDEKKRLPPGVLTRVRTDLDFARAILAANATGDPTIVRGLIGVTASW